MKITTAPTKQVRGRLLLRAIRRKAEQKLEVAAEKASEHDERGKVELEGSDDEADGKS